jgi:signal peptidase I
MRSKSGQRVAAARKTSGGLVETVKTIVYAVLIALAVRTIAYEPFNIPSGSMVPTLLVGDYLFVSKFSYGYSRYSLPFGLPLFPGRILVPGLSRRPQRGDVVVFKLPTDTSVDYIKRIIGLPGDHIQMIHGELFINGQQAPRHPDPACRNADAGFPVATQQGYRESLPRGAGEKPLRHCIIKIGNNGPLDNTPIYDVPPGDYFMMGDNRDNSEDSRVLSAVGYVPAQNLVGKAKFIFFSTDGEARWWQIWDWPFTIRYDRLFHGIH